ncbi:MAG: hypothetical protein HRU03_08535 [Nanoarchaeales archaeon]|nr:hypothetical protein [Nanoarchaeales archaeon]
MEIINNNTNFSSQFWLIEMNGGPETDCVGKEVDDCPNYTFEDIAYAHFPASIGAVQYFSGKEQVNYVGHSNGCRSALTSLSKHYQGENNIGYVFENGEWILTDLVANPVDKFFGIACPTTLNEETWSGEKLRKLSSEGIPKGTEAINYFRNKNITNVIQKDFLVEVDLSAILKPEFEKNKISLNLQEFYKNLYLDEISLFNGNKNVANKFVFFGGTDNYLWFENFGGDGVVPYQDMELLFNIFQNSELYSFYDDHTDIQTNNDVEKIIGLNLK